MPGFKQVAVHQNGANHKSISLLFRTQTVEQGRLPNRCENEINFDLPIFVAESDGFNLLESSLSQKPVPNFLEVLLD
jgi:hypothetical protein